MADQDLGISGKDVTVEMTIDGVPFEIVDMVTDWDENPVVDTITRKHVGTTRRDIQKVFTGWSGSLTITAKKRSTEDALDAYIAAKENRIPVEITMTCIKRFNDGTSKTNTYLDVQWEMTTSGRREDAVEYQISWETGRQRISA